MTSDAIRAALAGPRRVTRRAARGAQRPPGAPDAVQTTITPSARLFSQQPRIKPAPACYECANHMARQMRDGVVVHVVAGEIRECTDQ